MARPLEQRAGAASTSPAPEPTRVLELFDRFLEWVEANRTPDTFAGNREKLQNFSRYLAGEGLAVLAVADLKPYHVTWFLDTRRKWSSETKHNHGRAIQRAFNWAARQGIISASPIAHLDKPPAIPNERVVTPEKPGDLVFDVGAISAEKQKRFWPAAPPSSTSRPSLSLRS